MSSAAKPKIGTVIETFREPIVLALGLTQTIGYGTLFYAYGVLAGPAAKSFAIAPDTFFAFFSVALILSGFVAPIIGRQIDARGARAIMLTGSVVAAVALVLCAVSPNVWIFALAVVVMEVAACMVLYEAAFAALTQIYGHDARSRITAVTLIAGFASTIFWPVTQWLEIKFGWRATYMAFAVLNLIPCLLLHAMYLRQARAIPEQPTSSVLDVRETAILSGATRTRAIAWYAAAICASSIVYSALPLHMISAIRSAGFNEHSAALVAMIMGPSQVLARITEILLGDRFDAITTGRISLLALPISLLALLLAQYWGAAAFLFAATYGVSQGLISIARGTVPLQLFGVKGYATLVGRITGLRFYINAGGPFAFAFVATQYGMTSAIIGCLIASLIAGAAFLMLPKAR